MNDVNLRAADILSQRLYEAGCRRAFGMPGGEVLTLVDALETAGIEFTLIKHENAGGFIAEAVHHRDSAPAILVTTIGPGALNAINVVENAHQDRVPMIVLTGCVDAEEALTYTHQVLDHQSVFAPVTKATFRMTAGSAGIIADKALAIALEPRHGPVHIDIPISVADQSVPADIARPKRPPASPTAPVGTSLEMARQLLAEAQRPLAVLGLDILADRAHSQVRSFLEAFDIPFLTAYKAKGVLPEDHPLCLGAAGLSPLVDGLLLPLVKASDLVIAIGYDPIEMRTGWRNAFDPARQMVIDIAAIPNRHYMHQANINFIGHTGATVGALGSGTATRKTWPGGEPQKTQAAMAAAFPSTDEWGPAAVIAEARATLPAETLATADSGAHRILLSQMWKCHEPRGLIQSSALCTMGCALPMAIGLKLAEPTRPVAAFMGDAGFLMVAGELATAAELGLAPIFIVFADRSLSLIELKQRQRQLPNRAVDFARHDFAAMGKAFGGNGFTVTNRTELREALNEAVNANVFTVISAEIERGSYDGRI